MSKILELVLSLGRTKQSCEATKTLQTKDQLTIFTINAYLVTTHINWPASHFPKPCWQRLVRSPLVISMGK